MSDSKITISADFDSLGESGIVLTGGEFRTTLSDIKPVFEPAENDLTNKAVVGTVYQQKGFIYTTVPNANVTVYKNGIIYDYTKTDSNGNYALYLEDGIYDIKIQSPSYNRTIKNQEITNGIKQFKRILKSGQVVEKKNDMIEFAMYESDGVSMDTGLRYIHGYLINENGSPVENAEIIVANSLDKTVQAFVKTGIDGKYNFIVDLGDLDIILRAPNFHAKVIRNYNFRPEFEDGFMSAIIQKTLSFDKGGSSIWISY